VCGAWRALQTVTEIALLATDRWPSSPEEGSEIRPSRRVNNPLLGWGASASVQKDPGSLGYARDDTRKEELGAIRKTKREISC
jgi:hypothetical protein